MSARKYLHTPATDQVIRDAYRQWRVHGNRRAISLCAKRLGWPGHAIKARARVLGLAQTKEPPWSEREVGILERHSQMTDRSLVLKLKAAGFHRTETAVHLKLKRMRIRANRDWYSITQLADAFGVDSHKVSAWVKSGALHGDRRGTLRTERQGGDSFAIGHEAVRRFALRFPEEYDLAKVEKFWFLDLITEGRICR